MTEHHRKSKEIKEDDRKRKEIKEMKDNKIKCEK